MQQTPGLEAVAATLLRKARIVHPDLRDWRDDLVASPDETRHLEIDLFGAILDHTWQPDPDHCPGGDVQHVRALDEAAARLCSRLCLHREDSSPHSTTLHGIGGPLAIVGTSLAAAVAEFHDAVVGAWAERWHRADHPGDEDESR